MAKTGKNIRETLIIGRRCHERFLPLSSPRLKFLRDHGVIFSGTSVLRGKYEIRRKTNNAHMVLYTLDGSGWLHTGKHDTVLKAGDVWISPDGTPQEYALKSKLWEVVWFNLKDQSPWSVVRDFGTCIRRSVLGQRFKYLVDSILWETQTNDLHADKLIQLLSEGILFYLERELDIQYGVSDQAVLNQLHVLLSKVRANVQRKWTVAKLAEASQLFISTEHFSRLFVQHLGISPMRMVAQLRMEKARELLRSTSYPLKKIALLVGYENYFSFLTAFKRWNDSSPRRFRSQVAP